MHMLPILAALLTWSVAAVAQPAPVAGPEQTIDGRRYRLLSIRPDDAGRADVAVLELREAGPGLAAINRTLSAELPAAARRAVDCNADSLAGPAQEAGEYEQDMQPTWWTDRLLAVTVHVRGYCGGAHPFFDQEFRLWDTATGRPVDIAGWFTRAALKRSADREFELSSSLAAIVLKFADRRRDPDCADTLADNRYYLVQPGPGGMVFVPSLPFVVQACADDIVVPWTALGAFLSPAGRTGSGPVSAGPATRPAAPAR